MLQTDCNVKGQKDKYIFYNNTNKSADFGLKKIEVQYQNVYAFK